MDRQDIKVLAVIVTYNPESELLKRDIEALVDQVDAIAVFDNASANSDAVSLLCSEYDTIDLYNNSENLGLPINYNRAFRIAKDKGCEWMLIMDQDTVVPDDLVASYIEYAQLPDVAIMTPVIWDINICSKEQLKESIPDQEFSRVRDCISSASFNNVEILDKLGGFDEKLFIDQVDFDYCKNVERHGYDIIRINNCIVEHQIGNGERKRFLGKTFVVDNHSPIRTYYMFRNRVYFARKYAISVTRDPSFFKTFGVLTAQLLFEKQKAKKLGNAVKGVIDGFKL
jgi:rhamnosyltransferase